MTSRIIVFAIMVLSFMIFSIFMPMLISSQALPRRVFYEIPKGSPSPAISASADHLEDGSWTLNLDVDNFTFTEVCTNFVKSPYIGHAHIYYGGQKIGTAYSPIFSLGRLSPGRHEFTINLRSQDHRVLASSQGLIEKVLVINVDDAGNQQVEPLAS